jgi:hypothetical protein
VEEEGLCLQVKEKETLVSLKNVKKEKKKPYRQPSSLRWNKSNPTVK